VFQVLLFFGWFVLSCVGISVSYGECLACVMLLRFGFGHGASFLEFCGLLSSCIFVLVPLLLG